VTSVSFVWAGGSVAEGAIVVVVFGCVSFKKYHVMVEAGAYEDMNLI
jgi:hypothetical protein